MRRTLVRSFPDEERSTQADNQPEGAHSNERDDDSHLQEEPRSDER